MLKVRLDLHIHSRFSPDSLLDPVKIIRVAKEKGLNGVAIVDHNTVRGGVAARGLNSDPDFIVIPGAEYSTELGHVLGLFIDKEIHVEARKGTDKAHVSQTLSYEDVVQAIHTQGGIAVLAHPFQSRLSVPLHVFNGPVRVDAMEKFNARAGTRRNPAANAIAGKCSIEYAIPALGGSDAHLAWEIGRAYTEVDLSNVLLQRLDSNEQAKGSSGGLEDGICIRDSHHLVKESILAGQVEAFGRDSPRAVVPISELTKTYRRKTYRRVPFVMAWLFVSLLGPVGFWLETVFRKIKKVFRPERRN